MVYSLDRLRNGSRAASEAAGGLNDPLQHLVACHERIEERLQILERAVPHLRSDSEDKRRGARQALDKALEFLQTTGKLHTQDEEESVFPRVLASARDDAATLKELTTLLEGQHREKEQVLEKLVAHVRSLPASPQPLSADEARRLEGMVGELADHYRPHIMIENERLIPLSADYLKEPDLEQIRQEMKRRRGL